jgi:hypothetical protein
MRKQDVVDMLRRTGFAEVADEASRALPDPVDPGQAAEFLQSHRVATDELINRMGGSP